MLNMNVLTKVENQFREYFGTNHVFLVSSGKSALLLILLSLKSMRARSKVIIPAYTCFSVPSAVNKAGLTVVPCDIRPETLDFDWEMLKTLIDEDTLCVVPTHLFGIPSDVSRVLDISKGRGIYTVEDAAQALGGTSGEKPLGTLGDVSFFSLGRGKNITCGSGGVIVTHSEEIGEAIRELHKTLKQESFFESLSNALSVFMMSIFINPYLYWFPHGLPMLKLGETKYYRDFPLCRLSGFKAGLLLHWRESLDRNNLCRMEVAQYYQKELNLGDSLPIYSRSVSYLRFPVYVNDDLSGDAGYELYRLFGITRMYPDSINNVEEIRGRFHDSACRNSEVISKTLMTLPTHRLLQNKDKRIIIQKIKTIISDRAVFQ